MTFCTGVVYADLVDSAGTMIQSLGRFHRLNSRLPVTAVFLVEPHNKKAKNVLAKVEAINKLVNTGTAEDELRNTLAQMRSEYTEEELQDVLSFVAENYTGIDLDLDF